jgi:hypothetical protein
LLVVADLRVLARQRVVQVGRQGVAVDMAGYRQRLVQEVQGGVGFGHAGGAGSWWRRWISDITRSAATWL